MGASKVKIIRGEADRKDYLSALFKDLKALEIMLQKRMIETDIQRIGAEQELYLVDEHWRPAPIAKRLLQLINDEHFTTEYARFNIEINLDPLKFTRDALSKMEADLKAKVKKAELAAQQINAHVIQVGILPTVRRQDIGMYNVTDLPRYKMLTEILHELRGGMFELHIDGTDNVVLDDAHSLYEASNTSFQVHFQTTPDDFAQHYNWAQAITAPLMAITSNSPLLLGNRLWQETRIALFQQSIDTRTTADFLRQRKPRVTFGNGWIKNSVLEVYQEDIARHPAILKNTQAEDPFEILSKGEIPKLRALGIFNGTVYRWNRACYGITNGKPHIRIENRNMPSGPTSVDQMANAAFWLGMMKGMPDKYKNIHETTDFDYAKNNFIKAAQYGLDTQFRWVGFQETITPKELILDELLPIAKAGLQKAGIIKRDIETYLGIIKKRTETGKTGAKWQLRSFEKLKQNGSAEEALVAVTSGLHQRQQRGLPVHTWQLAEQEEAGNWLNRYRTVHQIMTRDVFIVNEKDSMELVANIMNWKKIRHILVENNAKELVGIISVKDFVKWFSGSDNTNDIPTVYELMTPKPLTVTPYTTTMEALELINNNHIACLPVVEKGRLLGVVSEHDFSKLAKHLMGELLEEEVRKTGELAPL
jgi:CBS domain-containing protein/gamma-glutamyl:cysteine ligase YbdK (ATP-grasp superfamily)